MTIFSKRLILAMAGALTGSVFGAGAAGAASPAYCALYAREYTAQFSTGSASDEAVASEFRIQEQAYSRCLNLDEEPAFPEASAYFGASMEQILGGIGGPLEEIAEGDTDYDDIAAPDEPKPARTAAAVAAAPSQQTAARSGGGGTVKRFSPEWIAWCKAHYPNSFDPISGLVTPFEGAPRLCPAGS